MEPTTNPEMKTEPVQPTEERVVPQDTNPAPPQTIQNPVATEAPTGGSNQVVNKPGVIVLQWLTYAFWGWTIIALGTLLATTLSHMVSGSGAEGFTPYGIAATLVLLPIAVVCDILYSKHEPEKKTGAASIVMVIHAVIFALLGIGSLITVVFTAVSLSISDASAKEVTPIIITALSMAIIYGATFVRALHPAKIPLINRIYLFFMIVVTTITIILAIVGPISFERRTKNDKLIVSNISTLTQDIGDYAEANDKLPETLGEIKSSSEGVKKLISSNLVVYKPNTYTATTEQSDINNNQSQTPLRSTTTRNDYYYQLCVTYSEPSSSYDDDYDTLYDYSSDPPESTDPSGYETYPSAYNHPGGEVCYKVKTTDYGY